MNGSYRRVEVSAAPICNFQRGGPCASSGTGNAVLGNYSSTETDQTTTRNSSLTLTDFTTATAVVSGTSSGHSFLGDYTATNFETDSTTGSEHGVAGTRAFVDSFSSGANSTTTETGNSDLGTDSLHSASSSNSTVTASDAYWGGGSDIQTLISAQTAVGFSFSNADTGAYSVTNSGTSSQSVLETGAGVNSYTLTGTSASTFASNEHGDSDTGAYTLGTSSTDASSYTRNGTDSDGDTFAITQGDWNSGSVDTTGDYTAIAVGADTFTTDETINGSRTSDTLHQVDSGDSKGGDSKGSGVFSGN